MAPNNTRNRRNTRNRLAANVNFTDPITYTNVDNRNAWYIKPNTTGHTIRTVYHKSTLNRIIGNASGAPSPITRHRFTKDNITPVPVLGRLHPDLAGKDFKTVFTDRDTHKYTYSSIKPGCRMDFTLDGDNNSITMYKRPGIGSSGNRQYQVNINLKMDVKDADMERALRHLANAVDASQTSRKVLRTRVIRV